MPRLWCSRCRKKDTQSIIDLHIPRLVLVPGVKLNKMTQSSAYKLIRAQKMDTEKYQEALDRHTTTRNIIYVQDATAGGGDNVPTATQIWRLVRQKDISRSIRFFLWMVIHEGYVLEDHWRHFPGFEDRGTCNKCGVPASMEHILTQSDENGQKGVWELVTKYGAKALKKPLVPKTWAGILQDEDRIPADWTRETRVVVGIDDLVVFPSDPTYSDGRALDSTTLNAILVHIPKMLAQEGLSLAAPTIEKKAPTPPIFENEARHLLLCPPTFKDQNYPNRAKTTGRIAQEVKDSPPASAQPGLGERQRRSSAGEFQRRKCSRRPGRLKGEDRKAEKGKDAGGTLHIDGWSEQTTRIRYDRGRCQSKARRRWTKPRAKKQGRKRSRTKSFAGGKDERESPPACLP
ncbi:hypothetical protein B0H13DRAFT_2458326 [Mycena leptocephala]|nr:hypothetical protein B0H13DRAFT_2458326 [Mycena leptocephala]